MNSLSLYICLSLSLSPPTAVLQARRGERSVEKTDGGASERAKQIGVGSGTPIYQMLTHFTCIGGGGLDQETLGALGGLGNDQGDDKGTARDTIRTYEGAP